MQREITVKELEDTVNNIDEIDEPIIIKREEQYKQGKTHNAKIVFKELREKYGY